MSWSGIVLTLALFGAEIRSPSLPTRPGLPRPIELGIGPSSGRPAPWSCRPLMMGRRGSCEWLDSIQDNLCPEGLVDEMTIAAARFSAGAAAGRKPLDPAKAARAAQYILIRSRARYQQIVHQTAHSLAASFRAIDSIDERVEEAARLRRAAERRLDASRKHYEEGRITAWRYLNAIDHQTTAVATETCSRIAYHLAIVDLEEAKGTLLAFENIAVAENEVAANSAVIPPVAIDGLTVMKWSL